MVSTRNGSSTSNACVGGKGFESVDVEAKEKASCGSFDTATGSSGLKGSGDCLVTYKRRKTRKVREFGKVQDDKSKKQLHDEPECSHKESDVEMTPSKDYSRNHQRNMVLEQMCQSLDSEGGLKKCIQDALVSRPGCGSRATVKESDHSCEDFTELCQGTFSDIIMSEKFGELCSLLLDNFQGVKADKLFDLSRINSRIKERAYDSSPSLFQSDIHEMWTKLQKVGNDIIDLTKCLSEKARTSFHEKVSDPPSSSSKDGNYESFAQEISEMNTKTEPAEATEPDEVHKCRHCGEKADGINGLVCDSCEKIYHISCINPPINEIPTASWYCTNCTEKETEPFHENCTACERLKASESLFEEKTEKSEENSSEIHNCKICRDEVKIEDEYKMCGHPFCPDNFYHLNCLTSKQLISYGPCWYCPSCLCRACYTDQDDDKIVLCDGCDHAYHIYCMDPPRSTIPEGKWFCEECDNRIKCIQEARRAYENNMSRKRGLDGQLKDEEGLKKPKGGVDVDALFDAAAKTLNHENILLAMGFNN